MCEKCRQREADADLKTQLRISIQAQDYKTPLTPQVPNVDAQVSGAVDVLITDTDRGGVEVAFRNLGLAIEEGLPEGWNKLAASALRLVAQGLEDTEAKPELFDTMPFRAYAEQGSTH